MCRLFAGFLRSDLADLVVGNPDNDDPSDHLSSPGGLHRDGTQRPQALDRYRPQSSV